MTRCKFVCVNNVQNEDGTSNLSFLAVTYGSQENEKFFKYTPSGSLNINVVNPETAKQFEQGKQYYIDITEA